MDRITIAGHGFGNHGVAVDFRNNIGGFGQGCDLEDTEIVNGIRHGMLLFGHTVRNKKAAR